jgi:hypothetical protein
MHRPTWAGAAIAALAAAAAAAPAASAAAPRGDDGQTATAAACKRAVIAGKRTCLVRGTHCVRKYERQYLRYGFSCATRDSAGRYRLAVSKQSF